VHEPQEAERDIKDQQYAADAGDPPDEFKQPGQRLLDSIRDAQPLTRLQQCVSSQKRQHRGRGFPHRISPTTMTIRTLMASKSMAISRGDTDPQALARQLSRLLARRPH
jgi:hypothetical protein